MACFGLGFITPKEKPLYPFTNFVLKVDATGGWEVTVAKVLKKIKEVANFMMHEDGMLQVSGTMDPVLLLKVLAKSSKTVQLVGWKFGGCSRNLHMPEFEQYQQYQQYQRYQRYAADIAAFHAANYNNYHMHGHGGGYRGGNHGYNYGGGYGRSNVQYLPHGHHHPSYVHQRH